MQVPVAMQSLVKLTYNAMLIALYAASKKGMPLKKRWKTDIENVALQDSTSFRTPLAAAFWPCSL